MAQTRIVCDGDSLTDEAQLAWPTKIISWPRNNIAVAGATIVGNAGNSIDSRKATFDALRVPGAIGMTWCGTNSLASALSAATSLSQLTTYVTERKAAGWTAANGNPLVGFNCMRRPGLNQTEWAAFNAGFAACGFDYVLDISQGPPGSPGDGIYWVNTDQIHLTSPLGHQWILDHLIWPLLVTVAATIEVQTGTVSVAARNKLIDHVRNVAPYTPAATHYLHEYSDTALTVPLTPGNAPGYAPASNANNTTTWPNAVTRGKASGVSWVFPKPTGTWPDVKGWKLTDSPTEGAGLVLASCSHSAVPVNVQTAPISYPIGEIKVYAPVGGFTNTVMHEAMNLMFGGVANSPRVTVYDSFWAGNPQAAGAQASASRVAVTQASAWAAASGGVAATTAPISIADESTGTYLAEHDAPTNGTLLFSQLLPAAPSGGAIPIGSLRTSMV